MKDNPGDDVECIENPNDGLCDLDSEEDVQCEGPYRKKSKSAEKSKQDSFQVCELC